MDRSEVSTTKTHSWRWCDFWNTLVAFFLFCTTGSRGHTWHRMQKVPKILIGCLDFFPTITAGDVAKRVRLSLRSIWLCRKGDILIGFTDIGQAYKHYLKRLGVDIPVYSPTRLLGEYGGDLIESILADKQLTLTLRIHGGVLRPIIIRQKLLRLAREVGLRLPPTAQHLIESDNVLMQLNSKRWFSETCRKLGIPTPRSRWCQGQQTVLKTAAELLQTLQEIRLRKARSAGGLGVIAVTRPTASNWTIADLVAQIGNQIDWSDWDQDDVAVEPFLPVVRDFSIVLGITDAGPMVVETCDRIVYNGCESGGGMVPSQLSNPILDLAKRLSLRFAWQLWQTGYRGDADIDWALLEDGTLAAFESNVRTPATMIQIQVREFACRGQGVAIGHDFLKVAKGTTFQQLLDLLRSNLPGSDQDILWKRKNGVGVIITLEPADCGDYTAFAATVLAPNHDTAKHISAVLQTRCQGTFAKSKVQSAA